MLQSKLQSHRRSHNNTHTSACSRAVTAIVHTRQPSDNSRSLLPAQVGLSDAAKPASHTGRPFHSPSPSLPAFHPPLPGLLQKENTPNLSRQCTPTPHNHAQPDSNLLPIHVLPSLSLLKTKTLCITQSRTHTRTRTRSHTFTFTHTFTLCHSCTNTDIPPPSKLQSEHTIASSYRSCNRSTAARCSPHKHLPALAQSGKDTCSQTGATPAGADIVRRVIARVVPARLRPRQGSVLAHIGLGERGKGLEDGVHDGRAAKTPASSDLDIHASGCVCVDMHARGYVRVCVCAREKAFAFATWV